MSNKLELESFYHYDFSLIHISPSARHLLKELYFFFRLFHILKNEIYAHRIILFIHEIPHIRTYKRIGWVVFLKIFSSYIYKIGITPLIKKAEYIVTTSDENTEEIKRLNLNVKIGQITLPLLVPASENIPKKIFNDQPLKSNSICLGFFGNITPDKGLIEFLDLLELLNQNHPMEFVFFSERNRETRYNNTVFKLYERTLPKISYTGFVPDENLIDKLNSLDVIVFPFLNGVYSKSSTFRIALHARSLILVSDFKDFYDADLHILYFNRLKINNDFIIKNVIKNYHKHVLRQFDFSENEDLRGLIEKMILRSNI